MRIDEYITAAKGIPAFDRTPAISDSDLDETIQTVRKGQRCIAELYTLLERIENDARLAAICTRDYHLFVALLMTSQAGTKISSMDL